MPLQRFQITNKVSEIHAKRRLLYVTQSPNSRLVEQLTSSGWHVEVSPLIHQPDEYRTKTPIEVALMDLSGDLPSIRNTVDWFRAIGHHSKWIALAARQQIAQPNVQSLIRSGFYDVHTLPADFERLLVTIGHAHGMAVIEQSEVPSIASEGNADGIVGESEAVRTLRRAIKKIGHTNAPVLISGESGTGKELAAKAIHAASDRRDKPFIPVNCGSIPPTLIQSELFGYEKGAFTGANKRQIGKIEAADGGTILLDEIGDLSLELQVNLLRFLEEQRIQRVGGTKEIAVDVRVIAATHVDLQRAVQENRFREDLYYRLNVLLLRVPALRARADDIEHLANCFFERFAAEKQRHVKGFTREALDAMRRYHWPGNIREMINRVRQALIMSENRLITPADLSIEDSSGEDHELTLEAARNAAEKEAISLAVSRSGSNLSEAARILGVNRGTVYRLMHKHRIALNSDEDEEPGKVVPLK